MGDLYYQDINLQMEKKMSKEFKLNLMYMNQRYDKTVIEGEGGVVKTNIAVAEGKYQINRKFTLRSELQYLWTKQDEGDWAYGLVELSALPLTARTNSLRQASALWNASSPYCGLMTSCTIPLLSRRSMKMRPPWSRRVFTQPASVSSLPQSFSVTRPHPQDLCIPAIVSILEHLFIKMLTL